MQTNVYLGTYTKKSSQGIYQAQLDTEKKQLNTPEVAFEVGNPTYLDVHDNLVFAIASQADLGGIEVFDIASHKRVDQALTVVPTLVT